MARSYVGLFPTSCLYFLIIFLLCPSIRPVQSIALSNLCGQFGHSCFGGNWGRRDLSTSSLMDSDSASNYDGATASNSYPDESSINNLLLDQIRSNIFRQRLRQFFESD